MTVSTVNVNGIRAAVRKGYLDWLADTGADVVCLQEVRATESDIPAAARTPPGWAGVLHVPSATKGRSGVSILSREPAQRSRVGFGVAEFEDSGRYLEIELERLVVASLYLPSGDVDTPRQAEKERFTAGFLPYLVELREKSAASGKEVLVCGDWNIAHQAIDLKNAKANAKNSGFLPGERAWMGRVFDEAGYVDVVRSLHPDVPGPYSWWSYRGRAFDNDAGWRIDYQVATPGLAATARTAVVERASSHAQRWSDHAPVTVEFAL